MRLLMQALILCQAEILDCKFSPDGQTIAAASSDKTICKLLPVAIAGQRYSSQPLFLDDSFMGNIWREQQHWAAKGAFKSSDINLLVTICTENTSPSLLILSRWDTDRLESFHRGEAKETARAQGHRK
jgi:hypothetical protein